MAGSHVTTWLLVASLFLVTSQPAQLAAPPGMCRYPTRWYTRYTPAVFNRHACADCLFFLNSVHLKHDPNTPKVGQLVWTARRDTQDLILVMYPYSNNSTVLNRLPADVTNQLVVSAVCGATSDVMCGYWRDCCTKAQSCCQRQLETADPTSNQVAGPHCPHTWDGFECFDATPANSKRSLSCPHYYVSDPNAKGVKECTANGTWFTHGIHGREYTDYTACMEDAVMSHNSFFLTIIITNVVTLLVAVPACIVFLYFRPLRQQQRIRLHVSVLACCVATACCKLLWEITVTRARFSTSSQSELLVQNPAWCRMLKFTQSYLFASGYMFMLAEGFHLHRLLVHAFTVPNSLLPYFAFCLGFPMVFAITWAVMRETHDNLHLRCWTGDTEIDLIMTLPTIFSLILNTGFLLRVIFIMVRQLEPHPNEPNNFRRTVKAVAVLVPLFGVQNIIVIIKDYLPQTWFIGVEILAQCMINLQGAMVALVFCFFNREAQGHIKSCITRMTRGGRGDPFSRFNHSSTATTQFTTDHSRHRHAVNSDNAHIPLRSVNHAKSTNHETRRRDESISRGISNGSLRTDLDKEEIVPLNPI